MLGVAYDRRSGQARARLTTFHRYKSNTPAATKRSLVATLCLALDVHAQLEEEIFYPAMASVDGALVARLIPEHDRMRGLIGVLRNAEPSDAQYDTQVMELMRELMHHVADEETALLLAPHAGELTRHKARATPKANLLLAAGGLIAGVLLFRYLRRHA